MIISWFSCGATSAVATKLALKMFHDVRVVYIDTRSEHSDSLRFLSDCEKWFGVQIERIASTNYLDKWDVLQKTRYINGPTGARCTLELKKKVRWAFENEVGYWDGQIFGFDSSEQRRALRFSEQYPSAKPLFPLIEKGLSKENCLELLRIAGIELPVMYRLGFLNNNCIGCVKGGMSYWSRIRKYFPNEFERMAAFEKEVGHSCIKNVFLQDLPLDYPMTSPIVPDCGLFCPIEFI
jgi:3'-phosphoadenosine 5'-phosphosulfate sulfotransferase (PAPS reductase)/FAD synthetase